MTIFSDHQKYFQIMIKTAIFLSVENEVRKVDNLPIGLSWWQCMSGYESHASTKSVSTQFTSAMCAENATALIPFKLLCTILMHI